MLVFKTFISLRLSNVVFRLLTVYVGFSRPSVHELIKLFSVARLQHFG